MFALVAGVGAPPAGLDTPPMPFCGHITPQYVTMNRMVEPCMRALEPPHTLYLCNRCACDALLPGGMPPGHRATPDPRIAEHPDVRKRL